MNWRQSILVGLGLLAFLTLGAQTRPDIDWYRARELYQKSQRGEALSAQDEKYLEEAKRQRAGSNGPVAASRESGQESRNSVGFLPLTELSTNRYRGMEGGLYGGGRNEPPAALREAAKTETEKIRRLDREGAPSDAGRIVLLSIGMSNTTQEFSRFQQLAEREGGKAPGVILVDGAQGGQSADRIATETAAYWNVIDERLHAAGVTREQVQVLWVKQAVAGPREVFPENARRLQQYLAAIVEIAKKRFPRVRIVYLSSRIYGGYASTRLNPEPHAYESAFAVRGLILAQLEEDGKRSRGSAEDVLGTPVLLWGPYLWSDGIRPRKSDGLIWERADFGADGTHPSESGRSKVAAQLLRFFKNDEETRRWFVGGSTERAK